MEVSMVVRSLSMVECFKEVEDPRIDRTKRHRLDDILALSVFAVISGAEGWEDIEEFGKQKFKWCKKFLSLPNGIPSHLLSASRGLNFAHWLSPVNWPRSCFSQLRG
jgi:hypothetical protein